VSRATFGPPIGTGRRPAATALAAAVLAVTVGGCGLFTRSSPTVAGPRPTRPSPTVVLLEAGSGPRRILRFTPRVGAVTELELGIDLHLTQRPDGTVGGAAPAGPAQVVDPPATHHRVRLTVTAADDLGYDVAFEVTDAGVEPDGTILTDTQIVELTAAVQQVVGLSGRMRLDQRGSVTSVAVAPGPGDGDNDEDGSRNAARLRDVERQLAAVVPVLPVEPVGRGARWRTTSRSTLAGVDVRQTTTYEITALDGDQVLYRATVTQDAGEQDVPADAPDRSAATDGSAPAARLLATAVTGTTSGRLSLTDLTSEHETRLVGAQVLDLGGDPTRRVRQEIDLVVRAGAPSP
jgi:hypothetical protein